MTGPTRLGVTRHGGMRLVCMECDKTAFATAHGAQRAADRINARQAMQLHVYQAPCGWHHLTRQPQEAPVDA